jgi:hypothetical protein
MSDMKVSIIGVGRLGLCTALVLEKSGSSRLCPARWCHVIAVTSVERLSVFTGGFCIVLVLTRRF